MELPITGSVGALPVIRIPDLALLYTPQFIAFNGDDEKLENSDLGKQLTNVLRQVEIVINASNLTLGRLVRLNICITRDEDRVVVQALLARHLPKVTPTLTFVRGKLSHPAAKVAMDGVCVTGSDWKDANQAFQRASLLGRRLLKRVTGWQLPGARVYISAQGAKAKTIADATRMTMKQLGQTLGHMGLGWTNVVRVKSFMHSMESVPRIKMEISSWFPFGPTPPLVFVESMSESAIQIELIVNAGPPRKDGELVEDITPPGMESMPVATRAVRVNRGKLIFSSSVFGPTDRGMENEVREIFYELERSMKVFGGDMKHLAKANCYLGTDESAKALSVVNPDFCDSQLSPAIAKARVKGVGLPGHSISIDLIGVVE